MGQKHVHGRLGQERLMANEQLVKDHAERIKVRFVR
jgi:hypothetical protein